jgi:hypothetical protein
MELRDAQREVREVYLHGAPGAFISATLWAISSALSSAGNRRLGIIAIVLGGALIFPTFELLLRVMGRRTSLDPKNPLGELAMQASFMIPLCLPIVGGAALYRIDWFYPALMIVVGAHYLPFVTLYGMRTMYVLGGALVSAGLMLGLYGPRTFALGGWVGTGIFVVFGVVLAGMENAARRAARS